VAKRNYLVDGLSGAGKSSVYEELIRRGYKAVTTDRAWKRPAEGGSIRSTWDEQKALAELESSTPDVLFVCGSSGNRERFLPSFTKVLNLRIDDDTMRRRLRDRTNNDFGKRPAELEHMLTLNRRDEKLAGAIDIDATRPLDQVVDEVLRLAACAPVNGDARPAYWPERASEAGRSFVIPERSLPDIEVAEELSDVLGRESIARIEYAWAGAVLTTLLSYFDEHGIDLQRSGRAETAAALSQAHERTIAVFASADRERDVSRLDPARFDGTALRRYYEQCNQTTAVGVEYAMLDGIAFFRDTLIALEPATVALLITG